MWQERERPIIKTLIFSLELCPLPLKGPPLNIIAQGFKSSGFELGETLRP